MLGSGAVIFASVGSMLPFERLVRGVDDWAAVNPDTPVFIQIGETEYEPRYAPFARILPLTEFRERLRACDLFVAHAGMGSILLALEERKQTLVLPRHRDRGEHTTDHQIDSAERFAQRPGLRVVDTIEDLHREMTGLLANPLVIDAAIADRASPELLAGVRSFLDGPRPSPAGA